MQTLRVFVLFSLAICTIPYACVSPPGAGLGQSFPLERGCLGT